MTAFVTRPWGFIVRATPTPSTDREHERSRSVSSHGRGSVRSGQSARVIVRRDGKVIRRLG